jgi:hypothetical protein
LSPSIHPPQEFLFQCSAFGGELQYNTKRDSVARGSFAGAIAKCPIIVPISAIFDRMIPPFDDIGALPPGVHPATLEEVETRFRDLSELRRVQMESVRWMVNLAWRAGVQRIVLNGSFVTDIMEPNDVDCVLLIGRGFPADAAAEAELNAGLPFIELKLVRQAEFDEFVNVTFATDRRGVPKGMIEVIR